MPPATVSVELELDPDPCGEFEFVFLLGTIGVEAGGLVTAVGVTVFVPVAVAVEPPGVLADLAAAAAAAYLAFNALVSC